MHVSVARITIRIAESRSLKSKRRVVKSLIDRIRSRYLVSVAEVEGQGFWQTATIGICCVGSSAAVADSTLSRVIAFIDSRSTEYEIVEKGTDSISFP